MEASAFSLDMPHPHDDPIPNAARMRAIGDLLARGIRRLDDIRRRTRREEILAADPATCLDLPAQSSVTVRHAASLAVLTTSRPDTPAGAVTTPCEWHPVVDWLKVRGAAHPPRAFAAPPADTTAGS